MLLSVSSSAASRLPRAVTWGKGATTRDGSETIEVEADPVPTRSSLLSAGDARGEAGAAADGRASGGGNAGMLFTVGSSQAVPWLRGAGQ